MNRTGFRQCRPPIQFAEFAALLLLVSSIIRTGACLYLPALPIIGENLGISDADMTLTLTVYFIVFALFNLLCGPVSDAYGRRGLIVAGGLIFAIGSFFCGMAQSNGHLLTGRIIQAIGASMIPGTSRAMIRDICSGIQVVSLMGWLGVLGALMLVAAPILGGVITETFGWRYNFWFLVIFSLAVELVMIARIPETLSMDKRTRIGSVPILPQYGRMLAAPEFLTVLLPVVFCFAFQGVYLAAAPFVFMKEFMLTPSQFGLSNIVIVVALTGGRYISVAAVKRSSAETAYTIGAAVILIAGLLFGLLLSAIWWNMYSLLTAVAFFSLGFGVITPIGLKSSLTAFRDRSGMASALQGFLVLGGTAVGSGCITLIMNHFETVTPGSILSGCALLLACLIILSIVAGRKALM